MLQSGVAQLQLANSLVVQGFRNNVLSNPRISLGFVYTLLGVALGLGPGVAGASFHLTETALGFSRRFFLSRSPCPLLEAGLCGVYAHRPLACRGVLTDEDPAYCDPENPHPAPKPHHGPGHFLRVPHRMARRRMEELWEEERAQTGFLVLGELSGLLYLLLTGLPEDREGVEARLEALGVLGGRFGFQVV